MQQRLFRAQVLARQRENLWGNLVLSRPLPTSILTLFLTVVTAAALAVLAGNTYTRKATVRGGLVPASGLISVQTPFAGIISALQVKEGDRVTAGTELLRVLLDHTLGSSDARSAQLAGTLQEQKDKLQERLSYLATRQSLAERQLHEQQRQKQSTLQHLQAMQSGGVEVLAIRKRALQRARELRQQGFLAQSDHDAVQMQMLEQEKLLSQLGMQEAELRAGLESLGTEFDNRLLELRQQIATLQGELAILERQEIQLAAETVTVIRAPVNGTVSRLQLYEGMPATGGMELLTLVPDDAELLAELEVPSNAMGFIQAGQAVVMRVDAFPYQKFGMLPGTIIQLSGSGRQQQPVPGQEAVSAYRILVQPDRQAITAYGVEQSLLAGMQVGADILLDSRSLLEWLLEPLFSITGTGTAE